MVGRINRLIAAFSPSLALERESAQAKLDMLQLQRAKMLGTYAPVGGGRRSKEFRRNSQDATGALSNARAPLAYIARDMLRNNPRVVRANNLFAGYTIGSGVRPVVTMKDPEDSKSKDRIEGLLKDHMLTTAIDADGQHSIFGMQSLSMKTIPVSGEVLLRRRLRRSSDGLPLPFQIQMLETDFIAETRHDGMLSGGRRVERGIEYGVTGRPEAFYLYQNHPGSMYAARDIRRVEAENIVHSFMSDRPGQRRGVSWYTPVMAELHDIHKFMQGTLKRQEVAAMFAGVLKKTGGTEEEFDEVMASLEAGTIIEIGSEEELDFNDPPSAESAEPIIRVIDRVIAAGLMLTYEGFTGDYSNVNYTSGRMGRMDQDPMVSFWQQQLIINQQMHKVSRWFKEAVYFRTFIEPDTYTIDWTAPQRPVVDPTKDYPALTRKIRSGLASRSEVIRETGRDPQQVYREWAADAKSADEAELVFDTDPRRVSLAGVTQARPDGSEFQDED